MAIAAAVGLQTVEAPQVASRSRALDVDGLYRRYGDMVRSRCRNLLRNDNDADEIAQEIFLRLFRYKDAFRGDASPTTYLFKITTSTCLNKLRSRRRRPEDPVEEPIDVPFHDSALDAVATRDVLRHVAAITDEGTQACLVYHYVDGMTHEEVGEILGVSAAAVRKRLRVFRERLKDRPPSWWTEVEP